MNESNMKKWLEDELKTRRQQLFTRQYMEDYYSSCGVTRLRYYLVNIKSTVCDEYYKEDDIVISPFTTTRMVMIHPVIGVQETIKKFKILNA